MGAEMQSGGRLTVRRRWFLLLSLGALALSIFGITRLRVQAGVPFTWENRGQQIVVVGVLTKPSTLAQGDVLLAIDQTPMRRGEEIEFVLDGKRIGQILSATVLRQDKTASVPIVLGSRYSLRYLIINFILGLFIWAVGGLGFPQQAARQTGPYFPLSHSRSGCVHYD